jgi:two-component system, NarL family, nitrate/nitrite response regulator NarL
MQLPEPITVIIADDQRAYREGLARAIGRHGRLDLIAVARDGDEAFDAIESLEPDVALVDVRMEGMAGTTVCSELRRRHPEMPTRVILMSAYSGPQLADEVDSAGADGFVSKDRSRREICEALVQAVQGDRAAVAMAPADPR